MKLDQSLGVAQDHVMVDVASGDDLREIEPYILGFADFFNMDAKLLLNERFYVLKPNAKNPNKQLYTTN